MDNSDEIDGKKVEAEKELQTANEGLGVVVGERHQIERQILELEMKKKDLSIFISKARFNVKRLESEIKILTNAFWKSRGK